MKSQITKNQTRQRKGSALLITLLIMSILIALTLGLSRLVISDIRNTTDLINSGKAHYAAEGALEVALLELHQNLSGYEATAKEIKYNDELKATYSIENQSTSYPYRDPELYEHTANTDPKQLFAKLELNQSVTIPLFVNNKKIEKFRIEYFVAFNNNLETGFITQDDIDVLRWKIFGLTTNTNNKKTEALSDYFPVTKNATVNKPMCLGTDINSKYNNTLHQTTCQNFIDSTIAREYYQVQPDGNTIHYSKDGIGFLPPNAEGAEGTIKPEEQIKKGNGYSIEKFIKEHDKNYITLTNIINPQIIKANDDDTRKKIANIYYRLVVLDDEGKTVREFATIKTDGFFSDIRQSIDAKIKLDQFLPVFNFSLYRTTSDEFIR